MKQRDQIDLDHVRSALVGTRFSGGLQHFALIDSTSSALLAAALEGAPEGTVYLADEQTAGRGRGDHEWHSSPGDGLYVSVLAKPSLRLEEALLLSLTTGLAAQQAILEVTGLDVDLRWPNDLLLPADSPLGEKKVGGILVETAVEPGPDPVLRYAVIGIGINLHQEAFPRELAAIATSLHQAEAARREDPEDVLPIFRGPLLIALLRALDMELSQMERDAEQDAPKQDPAKQEAARQDPAKQNPAKQNPAKGRARLLARFTEASGWVHDKRVHVPEQGGYTGTTAGLDPRGFLLVDGDDGQRRIVRSGGVRAL